LRLFQLVKTPFLLPIGGEMEKTPPFPILGGASLFLRKIKNEKI
jgi:hypothetical protein